VDSWINPTGILGGVLAVAAVAYLSAVYLVWDSRRLGAAAMAEYFRRRAVVSGRRHRNLRASRRRALPVRRPHVTGIAAVILSLLCGVGALVLLNRDAPRGGWVLAILAVASVAAWGVAQWPYLLPESLTVSAAASPTGTLTAVLAAAVLATVIVLPGFVLLYVLDQKSLLPEEGVDDVGDLYGAGSASPARGEAYNDGRADC
jgi:cytochrome d ubiquinol oxidase subunit II